MGAIFGFTGPGDAKLLASMRALLIHRGREGCVVNQSPSGTIAYLARGNEDERRKAGSGLSGHADAAVALAGLLTCETAIRSGLDGLLAAYAREGLQACRQLAGDFVAVVRDGATFHLVRDGAGARTIYYAEHNGRLLFASEPKAIWRLPGFSRRIRPASIAQFFTFSFVPGQHTMLEGLYELPPGHTLTKQVDEPPRTSRYFFFEDEAMHEEERNEDWVGRFRTCLAREVSARKSPGEPVAIFLSGGLDSSVVAAELARQATGPVHSFSLHFGKRFPHELDFARAVAQRCGTRHCEVEVRPKRFLSRMQEMIWHLDDPIGDPITMPNLELARHVSREFRSVFNGEGGDPCFGGPKNLPMMLGHWYGGIPRHNRFREQAYLASYRRGYEIVSRLLLPDWRQQFDPEHDLEGVLTPFFDCERPSRFLDKLTAMNIRLKGGHLILPKVERMLAAVGLIPLAPLFSARMLQLSFQIPSRLKLQGGVEKLILKQAYASELPREVIERPKSGMRVPVHFWFQGEMRRFARHILSPRNIRRAGIFDPQLVKQLLTYSLEERNGRYGLRLWMLLTFELWRRMVLEDKAG